MDVDELRPEEAAFANYLDGLPSNEARADALSRVSYCRDCGQYVSRGRCQCMNDE